ncbi:hypothetical protein PIB30_099582, partial [Stylosanthes scabra]|nr:hypothetical protein [Stylosanthes scabra]
EYGTFLARDTKDGKPSYYFLSLNFFSQVDAETKGDLSSRRLLPEFKSGHDLEWCCLGQEESHLREEGHVWP